MKTAKFLNWTDKPFTGYWDGKAQTVKPGQMLRLPEFLANHYATYLTNQELQASDDPLDESYTSPKNPDEVPRFMELFKKAYIPETEEEKEDLSGPQTEAEVVEQPSSEIEADPADSSERPEEQSEVQQEQVKEEDKNEEEFGGLKK